MDGHEAVSVRHLGQAGTKDVDLLHILANPVSKVVLITADKALCPGDAMKWLPYGIQGRW